MGQMPKRVLSIVIAAALVVGLAACNVDKRTASDELGCVYDSYFNHLKDQLPAGSKISTDERDILVTIPASNRFYNITKDPSRDPLAPRFITASDKNQTAVVIEGQARFRFNPRNACDWFSKHGRRNADKDGKLHFNARGDAALSAGWFNWLAENFGLTMKQVTPNVMNQFDWARAYYHYPVNADETGDVSKGTDRGEDTVVKLGNDIGIGLTRALETNLGGSYFCGVAVTEKGQSKSCPPINFQVTSVVPVNQKLLKDRQSYEETKQELDNARRTSQLAEANRAADAKAQEEQKKILANKLDLANLQAEIDFAHCAPFLKNGVSCDGKTPLNVGGNITITGK